MDEKTVRIHHDKHHAAYVAGANAAAENSGKLQTASWTPPPPPTGCAPFPSTFPATSSIPFSGPT
ncbi:MAG: hypothetical protein ACLU7D_08340 [Collinsella sp.]